MSERSEVIKLEYPIQLADRELTEVAMRRPTMADLRKHTLKGSADVEGEMKLFGVLCGLRLEEMDLMDSADYGRLQDTYVRFRASTER